MTRWVFEKVVWWQLPLLELLGRLGREPLYVDRFLGPALSRRLDRAERSGRVRRLELKGPLFRWNRLTADRAYELVEGAYPAFAAEHPLTSWMARRRGDEAAHLSYRKRLLVEIDRHLDFKGLAEAVRASLPGGGPLALIPADPLRASGRGLPAGVREPAALAALPRWVLALAGLQSAALKALLAARACAQLALGTLRSLRPAPAPAPADFAVGIINPVREFANDLRWSGFFMDGARLSRHNTLFVLLPPARLEASQSASLRERGLRLARPDGRSAAYLPAAAWETAVMLARGWLEPAWLCAATWELVQEEWAWSTFLDAHPLKNFIVYCDFETRHIGRGIAMKRRGVRTWYYVDATSTPDQFSVKGSYREFHWGYLYYDRLVSWGERHLRFLRRHHQSIGRYLSSGCLWSEHVRELAAGTAASPLSEALARRLPPGLTRVGVFDGTYAEGSFSPYRVGVEFAEHLLGLLESDPRLALIFKPKKPFDLMLPDTGDRSPLEAAYARLAAHPRCCFADFKTAAAEVIAESALVIGLAFSSPVLEALGARRKAIFHDPGRRFPDSFYDQIPDLVSHSPDELRRLVGLWLSPAGDERLAGWFDAHLKPDVDSWLDGRGITRFREMLLADEGLDEAPLPRR